LVSTLLEELPSIKKLLSKSFYFLFLCFRNFLTFSIYSKEYSKTVLKVGTTYNLKFIEIKVTIKKAPKNSKKSAAPSVIRKIVIFCIILLGSKCYLSTKESAK
jgi:uncharacterized protein (UPF0212 family)